LAQTEGVIEEESVDGPVRARPLGPSEINDEEADLNPVGRATETAMRVSTLLVRVTRAVLSDKKEEDNRNVSFGVSSRRASTPPSLNTYRRSREPRILHRLAKRLRRKDRVKKWR